MTKLQTLRERRASIADKAEALLNNNPDKWTDAHQASYDHFMALLKPIDAEIHRICDVHEDLVNQPHFGGNHPSEAVVHVDGKAIPFLNRDQKLSSFYPKAQGGLAQGVHDENGKVNTLSSFVRANMGVGNVNNNVTRGPALVEEHLAALLIDAIRAKSVISQSGASTIMIGGPSNITRIASDPTVYEHTEGANDISESTPVFEAVAANPKALVALIPLSAEAVADSANLDQVLFLSLAAAFAAKHDDLCLATILADATIPTSAAGQPTATWQGTLAAIGSAMGVNQGTPGALICNTADFIARATQTSTNGGWLGRPEVLKDMLELATTKVTAGTAIFGDWAKAFALVVRQGLSLEVVRFAKSGSYTHLLVAHARMAGYVLQPNGLYIQKATVA
ncbi:MAG: phage major capsid protein [Trichloromonadaceae bacterium]